jgi:Uma2 family endonuclease
MSAIPPVVTPPPIEYPDSDGKPMADNTKQWRWIATLKGNIEALFAARPDVFVAGDLLWYPVEGEPDIRIAPDVLVVFGRPRGDRGSYRQWAEDNVPVTVAFEVLSPGNEFPEMAAKYQFYEEHGVEEYYVYDPDEVYLEVYVRKGTALRRVRPADGFLSPCLGIRFDLSSGPEMVVYRPDGRPFLTFEELDHERAALQQRASDEKKRADDAEKRADQLQKRADDEKKRADRLAELALKAAGGQATPDELAELARLAAPPGA